MTARVIPIATFDGKALSKHRDHHETVMALIGSGVLAARLAYRNGQYAAADEAIEKIMALVMRELTGTQTTWSA